MSPSQGEYQHTEHVQCVFVEDMLALVHLHCVTCASLLCVTCNPVCFFHFICREPNKTQVFSFFQTDLGGLLPRSVVDSFFPSSMAEFYGNLAKAVKSLKDLWQQELRNLPSDLRPADWWGHTFIPFYTEIIKQLHLLNRSNPQFCLMYPPLFLCSCRSQPASLFKSSLNIWKVPQ